MSIRITTGMVSNQYSKNLNRETYALNKAATTAYDYRAFEKPSDDPFLAAQTFQIRRELSLNDDYTSNIENVEGAASSAESTLQTVANVLTNAGSTSVLQGITGTSNQSDRDTIATELLTMRESIVTDMNAQYGNRYLFSGAGAYGDAPFSIDSSGNLLYRGINVDTGENTNGASTTVSYDYTDAGGATTTKSMQINFGAGIADQLNGYTVSIASVSDPTDSISVDASAKTITVNLQTDSTKTDLQNLLQGASGDTTFSDALTAAGITGISASDLQEINISNIDDTGSDKVQISNGASSSITDYVNLDDLANETAYVDIGLGMQTDSDGKVVDQSAYNSSMPGISYLGYGTTTEDGTSGIPNNVYSLMGKMADLLKDSSLSGTELTTAIKPYMDAFTNSQDNLETGLSTLGTKVNFLDSTNDYITDVNLSLNTKDENTEYVDSADAITNYSMQQYSYQAALQVGTNILQPTLLDFMK